MDWHTDVKLLGMKKTRRDAMGRLLDVSLEKCRELEHTGNHSALFREKLIISCLTTEITKLNGEIFAMEKKLGINPGEIAEVINREYAANPG